MTHLRLVPTGDYADHSRPERLSSDWEEPVLDIPGLPLPTLSPMEQPDLDTAGEYDLPEPDPSLQLMLDQTASLFDGLTPDEKMVVGEKFYIDGDNTPRTRHGLLRVVGS